MAGLVNTSDNNSDTLRVNVDINEDYEIDKIYIHIKSDQLETLSNDEAENIIKNNGIVFQNNQQWVGTNKSFISVFSDNYESMTTLQKTLDRYGNLVSHLCDYGDGHRLFSINRDLLKDYFNQINTFMEKNYEVEDSQIYVSISNSFKKTEISNSPPYDIDKYLLVNTNLHKKNPDLELTLPIDLSTIIRKLQNKETLSETQQTTKRHFKKTLVDLIEKKKEDSIVRIHLQFSENEYEPIKLEQLLELLQDSESS